MVQTDPYDLNAAPMATLTSVVATPEAGALVRRLVDLITAHEEATALRQRRRRSADLESLSQAVGAFAGDLLAYAPRDGIGAFVYRSLDANSFSGTAVAYRQFKAAVEALEALRFVETVGGFHAMKEFHWGEGVVSRAQQGRASRFRATPALLQLANQFDVSAGACRDHFRQPRPDRPIVLKAKSKRMGSNKIKGEALEVPDTPEVYRLVDQVRMIDAFLDGVVITGGLHRGFYRGFEHGDQKDFQWNKGGRLYSIGPDNYQTLKESARLGMTFDGEAVVEIDIRSSYLTILHGVAGLAIDLTADPYEIAGVPRQVVKGWLVATLGAEKPLRRWPTTQVVAYREKTGGDLGRDHPSKIIRGKMVEKFPVLHCVGEPGFGWADLMFRESEAIIQTMLALVAVGIPSLPVHDSLIVPASAQDLAVTTLTAAYKEVVGVVPVVEVNGERTDKDTSSPLL